MSNSTPTIFLSSLEQQHAPLQGHDQARQNHVGKEHASFHLAQRERQRVQRAARERASRQWDLKHGFDDVCQNAERQILSISAAAFSKSLTKKASSQGESNISCGASAARISWRLFHCSNSLCFINQGGKNKKMCLVRKKYKF